MSADGQTRWHVYADAAALQERAGHIIARAADEAIRGRGAFHVVLAGGETPQPVYRRLATTIGTSWSAWHIYFGDERCLPFDHPQRNSTMAVGSWLARVPIPAAQRHIIPAERGAKAAARTYADAISAIDRFDLVILGLGEDGHTASLFPGRDWGASPAAAAVLAVLDAPKPPAHRVSLSSARLSATRQVLFLVTGANKHTAVARWRAGDDIPARAIVPAAGVDVLVEAAAFG